MSERLSLAQPSWAGAGYSRSSSFRTRFAPFPRPRLYTAPQDGCSLLDSLVVAYSLSSTQRAKLAADIRTARDIRAAAFQLPAGNPVRAHMLTCAKQIREAVQQSLRCMRQRITTTSWHSGHELKLRYRGDELVDARCVRTLRPAALPRRASHSGRPRRRAGTRASARSPGRQDDDSELEPAALDERTLAIRLRCAGYKRTSLPQVREWMADWQAQGIVVKDGDGWRMTREWAAKLRGFAITTGSTA